MVIWNERLGVLNIDARIVGERISEYRKNNKMTQQQLAERLSVTNKAISKWETGVGLPDIALLPALASALGMSVDELISDNMSENRSEGTSRRYLKKPAGLVTAAIVVAILSGSLFAAIRFLHSDGNNRIIPPSNSFEDIGISIPAEDAEVFFSDDAVDTFSSDIVAALQTHESIQVANVAISIRANSPLILDREHDTSVAVMLTIEDDTKLSAIDEQMLADIIINTVPDLDLAYDNISIGFTNLNTNSLDG